MLLQGMIQEIIIGTLFAAALVYLGKVLRDQFSSKGNCAKGCGCTLKAQIRDAKK